MTIRAPRTSRSGAPFLYERLQAAQPAPPAGQPAGGTGAAQRVRHEETYASQSVPATTPRAVMPTRIATPLLALFATCLAAPALGAEVLLITNGGATNGEESLRVTQFQSWGHTVTTLSDGSSQSQYDAALANADVVWVTEQASAASIGYKLREATIGVVSGEGDLDDALGFSTTNASTSDAAQVVVTDNGHAITSGVGTSYQFVFNANQPRLLLEGTRAGGLQELATAANGKLVLGYVDTDGALANTYNGESTALGRRVRLPWGGSGFGWSSLNSQGLLIAQQALDWAADGSQPEPDKPALWYTFDGTSGREVNRGTLGAIGDMNVNGNVARGEAGLVADGGRSAYFYGGNASRGNIKGVNRDPGSPWSQRTYEFWFRADSIGGRQVLFKQGGGTRNLTVYLEDDTLYFVASNRANDDGSGGAAPWGNPASWISTSGIAAGRTYHVAAVLDANTTDLTGQIRGYLNGELFDSATNVGPVWQMAALLIGRSSSNRFHDNSTSSQSYPFRGRIDEFKLWDGVLTDSTIRDIYRDGWGLMGHWRLDEKSGTTAADDSGSGRDGTHVGSARLGVEAVRRRGAEFNSAGLSDRVDLPHTAIDGLDTVSVSWWMHTTHTGQTSPLSGARGNQNNAFLFYFRDHTNFRAYLDGSYNNYSIDSIATGEWRHYVYQLDRPAGVERLYVNGELEVDGSRSPTSAKIDVDPGGLVLAQEQDSVGGGFDSNQVLRGGLDDVRIYARMITEREIGELYGLTGHWRLDETAGDTAANASLAGDDATYEEATTLSAEGARGTAVTLNESGTNDYVDLPHTALDNAESWAFAWWMRTVDDSVQTVLSGARQSNTNVLTIDLPDPEELRITLNNTRRSWAIPAVNNGVWRQFVVMHDGETGDTWLYANGQLLGTLVHPVTQLLTLDHGGLLIGQEQDRVGGRFDRRVVLLGDLDDVRTYNRLMTPAEVADHYGLVGWWRMEETGGTFVEDSSGAGNHGTILGSATWASDSKEGAGSLSLDGSDYVEIPSVIVDGQDGVTVAGWAQLTDTSRYGAAPINLGNYFGILLDYPYRDYGSFSYARSATRYELATTGTMYEDSGWRHFAAVYNASTLMSDLYVDGTLRASVPLTSPIPFDSAQDTTTLGEFYSSSYYRFIGELDDMRVYNRPLTLDEIRQLSGNNGSGGVRIVRWIEVANP
ncbi:Pentaxin family protein [Planctomycetes bacterium MalM25]|nr:Pentaxin family protein [Planctomycetes bacterium MalM25]